MEYLRLLYELPAIMACSFIVANLLPVRIDTRVVPVIMFCAGLVVLALPAYVSLSLALTIPAALVMARLGMPLTAHEPIKYHVPKHIKTKTKGLTKTFASRAYVRPGEETHEYLDADVPPEQPAGETHSSVKSFVPPL